MALANTLCSTFSIHCKRRYCEKASPLGVTLNASKMRAISRILISGRGRHLQPGNVHEILPAKGRIYSICNQESKRPRVFRFFTVIGRHNNCKRVGATSLV